jgi:uncharacterized protein (TIGR03000 family)
VLLAAGFLLAVPEMQAQDARGYHSTQYPWGYKDYHGYNEPPHGSTPPPPATAPVAQTPMKYTIQVTVLPVKHEHDDPNVAIVMAHVPEDAQIWFDGAPTNLRGRLRHFVSPSLTPGKDYTYTARVLWYEDGHWVEQVHTFPVRAGGVTCLDVVPSRSPGVDKTVADNLAKLDPEDRDLAEKQRFCAVQEGIRLGSMGVPVKVMVKGQPVFLCCEACQKEARAEPGKTLARVKKLKAKAAGSPRP